MTMRVKSGIKTRGTGLKHAVNGVLARHVGKLLTMAGTPLYMDFIRATKDVRGSQARVLRDLMTYAAATEYGRKHSFATVKTYQDYRNAVPVVDYEALRPYIDRHARGEASVLFPGKPIMYNRTSGTTALPKLIPVPKYYFDRSIKSRSKLWFYGLLRDYPGIYDGKDLSLVSSAVEGHTEDGTPFGSLSGFIYKHIPEFMKVVHTTPYEVVTIKDYTAKIYTMVRFALPSNVTCILTGNPASVVNLLSSIDKWKEDLIRDVRDGTLRRDLDLPPALRAECEALLEPAPERAAELERIASQNDHLRTCHYWPNLKLVHCWTNGNCRLVIPKLRPWLGDDTPVLDFGYIASEVNATDLIHSPTQGSVLQVKNILFEFTPYEEGDEPRSYLQCHELEVGKRYFVYVSTFGGLYRYEMNDVVEVADFLNEAPIIRFLFKGKGITSLQGEKLSEAQFIEAIKLAAKATGVTHEFFVGIADAEESRYNLYIEFCDDYSKSTLDAFSREIDHALSTLNIEYEAKLVSKRLKPLRVIQLGERAFEQYRALRLAEGALEGQLKWLNLCCTPTERDRMRRLVALSRETSPGACYESD